MRYGNINRTRMKIEEKIEGENREENRTIILFLKMEDQNE